MPQSAMLAQVTWLAQVTGMIKVHLLILVAQISFLMNGVDRILFSRTGIIDNLRRRTRM